jgi:DHA1 family inner membrane transport protein
LTNKLRIHVVILSVARIVTNSAHRMLYPFLPVFARGIGVRIEVMAVALSVRQSLGIVTPIIGPTGDIIGRRKAMVIGLVVFAIAFGSIALVPTYVALVLGLLLAEVGKTITDPSMFAYFGDEVNHDQRGMTIALSEFSWSGAYLLGVPFIGWLISYKSWVSPFWILAFLGLLAAITIWLVIPDRRTPSYRNLTFKESFLLAISSLSAIAVLVLSFLVGMASGLITIVYGVWLEGDFGLPITAIGASVAIIGIAELCGEGIVAILSNRIVYRKMMGLGILMIASASVLLTLNNGSLLAALIGLLVFFMGYEIFMVGRIPLMVEIIPRARSTMVSIGAASQRSGTALGILFGPLLFKFGIWMNSLVASLLGLIGLIVLILFVRENYFQ